MSQLGWYGFHDRSRSGREATIAQVVEAVDVETPETKSELASTLGISEQYLSELLRELKQNDIIKKGYVVDEDALYRNTKPVSLLTDSGDEENNSNSDRRQELLDMLERLNEVSRNQYERARNAFERESADKMTERAAQLESLTNERHAAIFSELKSYMLATEWPSNWVASDLATMATNLEIVGDRACFIADTVANQEVNATGIVAERVVDVFQAGERINDRMNQILFSGDVERYDDLQAEEESVHRDINELFELVTAYDPEIYGYLVTITRALERAIFYWVHTAELAVRLHTSRQPEHIAI